MRVIRFFIWKLKDKCDDWGNMVWCCVKLLVGIVWIFVLFIEYLFLFGIRFFESSLSVVDFFVLFGLIIVVIWFGGIFMEIWLSSFFFEIL